MNEKFGDGIMSAITFSTKVEKGKIPISVTVQACARRNSCFTQIPTRRVTGLSSPSGASGTFFTVCFAFVRCPNSVVQVTVHAVLDLSVILVPCI